MKKLDNKTRDTLEEVLNILLECRDLKLTTYFNQDEYNIFRGYKIIDDLSTILINDWKLKHPKTTFHELKIRIQDKFYGFIFKIILKKTKNPSKAREILFKL